MRISSGISRPDQHADHDDQRNTAAGANAWVYAKARNSRAEENPPTSPTISSIEMKRGTRPPMDEARQRAADAHGEQVAADDGGELEDAVAEQIAGQRAGDQLVDQPAGGDQEDGDEED